MPLDPRSPQEPSTTGYAKDEPAEGITMKIRSSIRNLLLLMGALLCFAAPSFAQIGISVSFGPPALPIYEQPVCPGDGFIWTPGYWAYAEDSGYYWVPGTWVEAPQVGYLWTPGYWGWGGNAFLFHQGYWGPTVGFYGGVSYGFGYYGHGYEGGRWDGGHFFYNRSVTNVNVTVIHNVYNTHVTEVNNRVSYNGGNGGVEARATAEEERANSERHIAPVAAQTQHVEAARANPELRATANQGRPPIAATQRANDFKGNGVVAAKEAGAPYKAPEQTANNGAAARTETNNAAARTETNNAAARTETNNAARTEATPAAKPSHVKDIPPPTRTAPNTGNPATDKKYQAQQDKMYQQQDQQRQKLAAQQEKEHQQATQQKANDARNQQLEQKHQQQTDALVQKHTQQQQQMQKKQAPPPQQHSAPPPAAHNENKPK
jgi:WXXGXW repeat (2 copies)